MSDVTAPQVLIVDDVMENIQVVAGHLKRENYDLLYATDGKSALETLSTGNVDLILLDIMMPGMSGFEVCEKIKQDPRTRDIPVIFLTAKAEADSIIKGFETGGVDYITKPFNPPELLARVRTHLRLQLTEKELRVNLASRDRFLSIISHQLTGPFAGLNGMLKQLLRGLSALSAEELEEFLQMAADTSDNIALLLENLLSWSHLKTGILSFQAQDVPVSQALEEQIQLQTANLETKALTIKLDAPPDLTAIADLEMFETIMENLITNAIKYSREAGEIDISAVRGEQADIVLRVKDHGVGMTPLDMEKLFRLELLHNTPGTRGEAGTGLGLILSKELARQNGGGLAISSAENIGTTAELHLPAKGAGA